MFSFLLLWIGIVFPATLVLRYLNAAWVRFETIKLVVILLPVAFSLWAALQ